MKEKNDLMKNIGGNESNNLRKYLILGGGVFVLFVVGIVASKFMFSSPKQDNTKVILPADIKQDNTKDAKLFNDIPIENENANANTQQFQKPQTEQTQQNMTENAIKKPQVKPAQPKAKPQQKPIQTTTQKQTVEKKVVKPKAKPQPKTVQKANVKREYYIQVAAVTRGNPSKKFLALIKKNGFNYKIEKINIKGMKVQRVLIGGYTYKEVKQALPKVKAKISSSAFIKRVK